MISAFLCVFIRSTKYFEVLQIDPETEVEVAKKKYKKLSLLIHPDKNPDDRDRADKAFDGTVYVLLNFSCLLHGATINEHLTYYLSVVKKALKQIEDPDELSRCREMYTEARARLAIVVGFYSIFKDCGFQLFISCLVRSF